jgi:hypothetical protein
MRRSLRHSTTRRTSRRTGIWTEHLAVVAGHCNALGKPVSRGLPDAHTLAEKGRAEVKRQAKEIGKQLGAFADALR